AWSAQFERSTISARSLRTSTAARRTVQTLIGSNVAFSTRTRPLVPSPRRTVPPDGSAASGAGSSASAVASWSVLPILGRQCSGGALPACRVTAENSQRLDPLPERAEGLPNRRFLGSALEVREEHVVAELHAARA